MKLNHLSLSVPQVAETSAFMQHYFGFKQTAVKGNNQVAVLEGAGGFIVVLTTLRKEDPHYPSDFHFGFILEQKEQVDQLHRLLVSDGYPLPRLPAKIRHSYAFYFHMPGEIMVEISCNLPSGN